MLKVVLLDPYPVILRGIKAYFKKSNLIDIIGAFEQTKDLFNFLNESSADLVIMEMQLEDESTIKTIKKLKKVYPKVVVLIFTSQTESKYEIALLKAGAAGYLSKKVDKRVLKEAIEKVTTYSYHLTSNFEFHINNKIDPLSSINLKKKISKREIEVLKFFLKGKRNVQIAKSLGLNQKTTNTYKNRLMKKLSVNNNVDLYQQVINLRIL